MPTPTTPTWISPANGATVDASVLLQWTAGTVSGGGGAPGTATIVSPLEGADVEAQSAVLMQASVTPPSGQTVSGVNAMLDGALFGAMTFNAGNGYWERAIKLASGTTLGNRVLRADATFSDSTTAQSSVRNFTAIAVNATVSAFSIAVNAKKPAGEYLMADEQHAWSEFWARLGDRDGELGVSYQAALADAFCLRSAYNVGSGEEWVGFKQNILTRQGTTLPAWGANGTVFAGTDAGLVKAGGLITGATKHSLYALGKSTASQPANSLFAAAQNDAPPVSGGVGISHRGGTTNAAIMWITRNTGVESSAATASNVWGVNVASMMSSVDVTTNYFDIQATGVVKVSFNNAAVTGAVPAKPFVVGNESVMARGWNGSLAVVLAFTDNMSAKWDAIDAIVRSTIGAGVV